MRSTSARPTIFVADSNNIFAKAVNAHTEAYHIDLLVYFETHETLESALTREKLVKRWKRAWKDELVESVNPTWQDIS